jgi:hypothetical protein
MFVDGYMGAFTYVTAKAAQAAAEAIKRACDANARLQAQTETPKTDTKNTTEFKGKTVTQNDSLFDPYAVDKQGRTNIQRMEDGLAPIGYDGKSINVHHIDQTNTGPVMEMPATEHQQNYSDLHSNTGQAPSQIDRNAFNQWREAYWKWRANDFK